MFDTPVLSNHVAMAMWWSLWIPYMPSNTKSALNEQELVLDTVNLHVRTIQPFAFRPEPINGKDESI